MAELTVSVALATYNGARHVQMQLADIARQSWPPAEIVINDDASTDDTLAIVERFATSADLPVRVHRNSTRVGFRENFIRCAGRCTSDIIAFCDQDDRWSTHKFERLLPAFADPDVLLVYHDAAVASEHDRVAGSAYSRAPRPRVSGPLSGPPWQFALGFTQAFRRSLTEFDDLWPSSEDQEAAGERIAHDRWYFFLASVLGVIIHLPDQLAQYRQHDRNTYGWRRFAPNLPTRVLTTIRNAGRSGPTRVRAAQSRAAILDAVANRVEGEARDRALAGAKAYRALADISSRRAAFYASAGRSDRLRQLRSMVRDRAYDSDAWRFGRMALAMDSTVGLAGLYPRPRPLESQASRSFGCDGLRVD